MIHSQIQTLAIASHFFEKKSSSTDSLTLIMYNLHPVVSHKPAELAQLTAVLTQLACQL